MVTLRHGGATPGRWRAAVATTALVALAPACTQGEPLSDEPTPTIEAAPASTAPQAPDSPPFGQPAHQARPIVADGGDYPISRPRAGSGTLFEPVSIGRGRIWVPWPPYAGAEGPTAVTGTQSALHTDLLAGYEYAVAQRARWDAMPPYLDGAQQAFADGTRVAQRRAGTETAWELAIDPGGLDYETRLDASRSAAFDHVTLCPPHPTPEVLGADLGETPDERDRAGVAIEAFMMGMRSPGGRPMHSWGTTVNHIAKLLAYSPGEPMELALGGHSLTDLGFFPGDWSAQAAGWLTRRAAQGAVTDSLVAHAVLTRGPQTLWEACSDLATITPGIYTESHRVRQLESLWARGLRLEFTSPPVERAWVADLSAAGHALAVVCHRPGRSYLVDASSGERLDAGIEHPAQVEAMWLTWSRRSYRVLHNALFDGACDGDAFGHAVQWLHDAKRSHAASIDWTDPHAWGAGVRNQWVAVRYWVAVPQAEAWRAHRDHGWHQRHWCRVGIPVGAMVDGELQRPDLAAHCTPEQWAALNAAAGDAPEVTWELTATKWEPGASWHDRLYLSPFKSLEEILGCRPDAEAIATALSQPVENRVKKPWPPGSLAPGDSDGLYPRPMPPCPQAGWPPQTDRYWWPSSASLVEATL